MTQMKNLHDTHQEKQQKKIKENYDADEKFTRYTSRKITKKQNKIMTQMKNLHDTHQEKEKKPPQCNKQ